MLALYLSLVKSEEERLKVELIYKNYRAYMTYCAVSVLADKSEAEDAVHEAMLRIIRYIAKVRVDNPRVLRAFCGKVAENVARDMNRRGKERRKELPLDDVPESEVMGGATPEVKVLDQHAYEVIRDSVEQMTAAYKTVCLLKFVMEFDDPEIADLLDMNPKTVSSYASRGRAEVKSALKKEGYCE